MNHNITDRAEALDHIGELAVAARVVHATALFDALEAHRHAVTANDLHDLAFSAWREFVDVDFPIPVREQVAVFLRAARFLPEQIAVDLAAETFDADAETWQRFPDGSGLRYMPADDMLVLSYPTGERFPSVVEVVLVGGRVLGRI